MRRLLLLVGAVVFVDATFFAALTPLLPELTDRHDLSKAGAGLLAGAYPIGVFLGGIPAGIAAARLGVKPVAVASTLLVAATTVVFAFADSIVLLDVARLAQGLASAGAWTACLAWLIGATPAERRGELIGTAMGVAIGGAVVGPVLGGVASLVGIRTAFSAVGAVSVALAGWAVATQAPPPRAGQSVGRLFRALGDRMILVGMWLVTLPALLFGALYVLAPLRLHALGFGAVAIGAVYLVATAGEAVVPPLLGRYSDRRGRLLPIAIGLAGSAAVTVVLPWPSRSWLLALVVVLAALSFGVFWAPAMSLLSDTAEGLGLDHAFAFALVNLAWASGQAVGSAGGGALARATADAVPYLILCGLCLLTLAAVRRA